MNFTVEHFAVPSTNPAALKEWYQKMLGAGLLFDNGRTPPTCLISLGNVWLEIYQADSQPVQRDHNGMAGFRHMSLKVDSIAQARRELEEKGVVFTEAVRPAAGAGQVLFFKDLDGNLLHLVERPEGFHFSETSGRTT